jgi:transposase
MLRGDELWAEVVWLLDGGMTPDEVAGVFGRSVGGMQRAAERYGLRGVASRLREKTREM